MINFDRIEHSASELRKQFGSAAPFEHVVIDDFCDDSKLRLLHSQIPDPIQDGINRSRDYVFAKNKFEKSSFRSISHSFSELHEDMTGNRFKMFLRELTGQDVFVDPAFHGGGIHQGGDGSFLDMHVDFNTHPLHEKWFRNLNILLYLNREWDPSYGGELKIRHRDNPDYTKLVEPLFNRCVIMFTRDYTVHGYDRISFPPGRYRQSLAAYAYSELGAELTDHRTTVWYPDEASSVKKAIGKHWPKIVKVKNYFLGSSTAKNK
jgi:hypothetical protein